MPAATGSAAARCRIQKCDELLCKLTERAKRPASGSGPGRGSGTASGGLKTFRILSGGQGTC
jgi:hypothetical protein